MVVVRLTVRVHVVNYGLARLFLNDWFVIVSVVSWNIYSDTVPVLVEYYTTTVLVFEDGRCYVEGDLVLN